MLKTHFRVECLLQLCSLSSMKAKERTEARRHYKSSLVQLQSLYELHAWSLEELVIPVEGHGMPREVP